MRNCRLFSSYSVLFNSLNMSSNTMLLRRKTNVMGVVVDKLATKRLYSGRALPKEKEPPNPQDQNPWTKRREEGTRGCVS